MARQRSEVSHIEQELKDAVYRAVCEVEKSFGIDLEGDGLREVQEVFLRKLREQDYGDRMPQ